MALISEKSELWFLCLGRLAGLFRRFTLGWFVQGKDLFKRLCSPGKMAKSSREKFGEIGCRSKDGLRFSLNKTNSSWVTSYAVVIIQCIRYQLYNSATTYHIDLLCPTFYLFGKQQVVKSVRIQWQVLAFPICVVLSGTWSLAFRRTNFLLLCSFHNRSLDSEHNWNRPCIAFRFWCSCRYSCCVW